MNERVEYDSTTPAAESAKSQVVSTRRYSLAFFTLLLGSGITVMAATLSLGLFNPALPPRSSKPARTGAQ